MPLTQVKVLNGSAIQLAIQYFQDATSFVNIMQQNWLDDYVINGPVVSTLLANNLADDTVLVLAPTRDIAIGDLAYCSGLDTYGTVLNVQQIYTVPGGLPFCQCSAPVGTMTTTPVSITTLVTTQAVTSGSVLTFAKTGGIVRGQSVYALNILDGTVVFSVSSTTVTLSNAVLGPIGNGSNINFGSPAELVAILPPTGVWVSTNVTITPDLDNPMPLGNQVTFASGTPTTITIPSSANTRGVPT